MFRSRPCGERQIEIDRARPTTAVPVDRGSGVARVAHGIVVERHVEPRQQSVARHLDLSLRIDDAIGGVGEIGARHEGDFNRLLTRNIGSSMRSFASSFASRTNRLSTGTPREILNSS